MELDTHTNGVIPATDNLPAVETVETRKEREREEAEKARTTDLYRLLKLASDISGKCNFCSYHLSALKAGKMPGEYELDALLKELMFAECFLEKTRQIFQSAKDALIRASGSQILEELAKE